MGVAAGRVARPCTEPAAPRGPAGTVTSSTDASAPPSPVPGASTHSVKHGPDPVTKRNFAQAPPGRRPEELSSLLRACCMVTVHVIVVGCGRVGSGLATGLLDQGHSVAIIDRNAKAFRRLPPDWPGTLLVGSGFDRDTLDK